MLHLLLLIGSPLLHVLILRHLLFQKGVPQCKHILVMGVSIAWILTNYFFEALPLLPYTLIFGLSALVVLKDKGIESIDQRIDFFPRGLLHSLPVHINISNIGKHKRVLVAWAKI